MRALAVAVWIAFMQITQSSTSPPSSTSCSACVSQSQSQSRSQPTREGDPGGGGLQGTRPRAWQLGGPASRGLRGVFGLVPSTLDHSYPIPVRLDTDTVKWNVKTLLSKSHHSRIKFTHQFFTEVTCLCRALDFNQLSRSRSRSRSQYSAIKSVK
eukprot:1195520-Prorocentrum_minimum.AAC.3